MIMEKLFKTLETHVESFRRITVLEVLDFVRKRFFTQEELDNGDKRIFAELSNEQWNELVKEALREFDIKNEQNSN